MKWILTFTTPIFLLAQTGHEIAHMVDQKPAPKDLTNKARMILTNSKGKSRSSEMVSKSLNKNEKQMIWFLEPKDDRGVSFLKIEHENRNDEMRMWLPALKECGAYLQRKKVIILWDLILLSKIFQIEILSTIPTKGYMMML